MAPMEEASGLSGGGRFAPLLMLLTALSLSACDNAEDDDPDARPVAATEGQPAVLEGLPAPPIVAPVEATPAPITPVVSEAQRGLAVVEEVAPAAAANPPPAVEPPAAADAPPADPTPLAAGPAPAVPNPAPDGPQAAVAAPTPAARQPAPGGDPPVDPDLRARVTAGDVVAGAAAGAVCGACHTIEGGAGPLLGPNLYGILGAPVGRAAGFTYSPAMAALGDAGATWTVERIDAFLADPDETVPGTRMTLPGITDPVERADLIAWLRTLAVEPVDIAVDGAATIGRRLPGLTPVAYSEEQISFGRDTYNRFCSRCHGPDFFGRIDEREWGSAPALIGPLFINRWYDRTVWDVFVQMRDEVNPEFHLPSTPEERYVAVLAYILQQQGFVAGPVPLTADQATLERMGFWQ